MKKNWIIVIIIIALFAIIVAFSLLNELSELIKQILIFCASLILGYFTHILKVRFSRQVIITSRLEENINKVEEFISLIDELQYSKHILNDIEKSNAENEEFLKLHESYLDNINLLIKQNEVELAAYSDQIKFHNDTLKLIIENSSVQTDETKHLITTIRNEIKKIQLKQQTKVENAQELLLKCKDAMQELTESRKKLAINKENLQQYKKQLDEYAKKIALSDMDTICLLIDPKGKLSNYMCTLINLHKTDNNSKKITQTKIKIRTLLNKNIMNY